MLLIPILQTRTLRPIKGEYHVQDRPVNQWQNWDWAPQSNSKALCLSSAYSIHELPQLGLLFNREGHQPLLSKINRLLNHYFFLFIRARWWMLLPARLRATHNITVLRRGCCLPACVFACMDHRSGVSLMHTSYWWSVAPESLKGTLWSPQATSLVQSRNWLGPSLVPAFPNNQTLPPQTRPSQTSSLFLDVPLLHAFADFFLSGWIFLLFSNASVSNSHSSRTTDLNHFLFHNISLEFSTSSKWGLWLLNYLDTSVYVSPITSLTFYLLLNKHDVGSITGPKLSTTLW